jgi:hypothetical protein
MRSLSSRPAVTASLYGAYMDQISEAAGLQTRDQQGKLEVGGFQVVAAAAR